MAQLLLYILDTKENVQEICFTLSDMQDWLIKKGFRGYDSGAVRRVVQDMWNVKPERNSVAYLRYGMRGDGSIHAFNIKGRFYTIGKIEVMKFNNLDDFDVIAREGINVVLRHNNQGNIYGMTYIDFKTKCVFNGSDLGREFSAKGIRDRLTLEPNHGELNLGQKQSNGVKQVHELRLDHKQGQKQSDELKNKQSVSKTLELLLKPERNDNYIPHQFLKKKTHKQSRSRGIHL